MTSKRGTLFILLIDASGSMAAKRISLAKGAALGLLKDSYIRRDQVAIVGFRGTSAEVLLPPSKSMLRARRVLDSLGVGGGTPLSAGLLCSLNLAKRTQTGSREIVLLIFTDGNANVSLRSESNGNGANPRPAIENEIRCLGSELQQAGVKIFVINTENRFVSSEKTRELADKLGGTYVTSWKLTF
ncbi:MAG: VWA domain-containing protein [Pyrinomonadaceae bacterium]